MVKTSARKRRSKLPTLSLKERSELLRNHPCFAQLYPQEITQLASLLKEKTIPKGKDIVTENDLVDSIYFVVKGRAEVKHNAVPVATLETGEVIGLSETGFYSSTGKRTATVTSLSRMLVLQLDIEDFDKLAHEDSHLDKIMREQAELLQRMNLIKHAAPFEKLNADNLKWLAGQTKSLSVSKGNIIFNEGDEGDYCYLIQSGKVEIYTTFDEKENKVATLESNMVFGETSILLNVARTASARTMMDCKLLALGREALSEATKKNLDIGKSLMILTKSRVRPKRYDHIEDFSYRAEDGQHVIVLKDSVNHNYYRLSEEGLYLWKQINGTRTVHDLAKIYYKKFNDYDPAMISGVITDLMEEKFVVANPPMLEDVSNKSFMKKVSHILTLIFEASYSFGHADQWVSKEYQRWVKWLYIPFVLKFLFTVSIVGFLLFIFNFSQMILLLRTVPHPGWALLATIPISMVSTVFHELAHAFTTKHFGREVRNFGVGWYWFGPVAFCDTSDMWLNPSRQRVYVDIAGMFADSVFAAAATIFALFVTAGYVQLALLLFSMLIYINILHNLTPYIELDGYYILSDMADRDNLRLDAVVWVLRNYSKLLKKPSLLFQRNMAVLFWWISIIVLLFNIAVTYIISKYLLYGIFGVQNPLVSLLIMIIVIILSSLTLITEARKEINQSQENN